MTLLTLQLIIIGLSQLVRFQEATNTLTINQVIASTNDSQVGSCLSVQNREKILLLINDNIMEILTESEPSRLPQCGAGLWYRVADLNTTSDSMQQCPSNWPWMEKSTPVRACGRPTSTGVRCVGEYFPTRGVQYGKVCGRVLGYQNGSADSFRRFIEFENRQPTIDEPYVDGVSVTHGMPQARTHIWIFAAGATEATVTNFTTNCPCSNAWATANAAPAPSFVGDNYFCESGNSGGGSPGGVVYAGDPLWDGEQCEGECCSNGKSPPWFSVTLPNPTSDDIEVRICGDEDTDNEDTSVQLLEIFIQ